MNHLHMNYGGSPLPFFVRKPECVKPPVQIGITLIDGDFAANVFK